MHPRGTIVRPDESRHTRASVWIEQEIAIAAYIRTIEERDLPVIAFQHESVGREGMRDLIQLNPRKFKDEAEVLDALPGLLLQWKMLSPTGIRLDLESEKIGMQQEHHIRRLNVYLVNDTSKRITKFDATIQVPSGILRHWDAKLPWEIPPTDGMSRLARVNEENPGPIRPKTRTRIYYFDYCMKCALDHAGGIEGVANSLAVDAKIWIDHEEYTAKKTLIELREEADMKGEL